MAAAIVFLLSFAFLCNHLLTTEKDSSIPVASVSYKVSTRLRCMPHVNSHLRSNFTLVAIMLLLSGDIEVNPGPTDKSVYPCEFCDLKVLWSCAAVCCDNCSIWYHKSCLEMCSDDFSVLNRPSINWLCCKCDSVNVSSFMFHSYETDSNFYWPIQDSEISLDSFTSSVFSPLKASSPNSTRSSITQ